VGEILVITTAYNVDDYFRAERGETAIEGDRDSMLREIAALKKTGVTAVQVMPSNVSTFE